MPPCVGNHSHRGVIDFDDLLHTLHVGDFCSVVAFQLAAKIGADLHSGVHHAGHGVVDGIDLAAIQLRLGVEPWQRFTRNRPGFRIFQRHIGGRCELCRSFRQLPIAQFAIGRTMADKAFPRIALRDRNTPLISRGLDKHDTRSRAPFADIILRIADATRSGGLIIAPDAIAFQVFTGCWIIGRDLFPIALQLFGDELGQSGQGALPHLNTGHTYHNRIIRFDDDPGIEFWRLRLGCGAIEPRNIKAEREAGGRGHRAGKE